MPGPWRFAWRNPTGSEYRSTWTSTEADVRSVVADLNRRWAREGVVHWAERVPAPMAPASAPSSPCPRCHGSGYLTEDPLPGCPAGPSVYEARECPACEGTGEATP